MLVVDPEMRPTAQEIVEYIEHVGKAYRPLSGKVLREHKPDQAKLLKTIEFTDSLKNLKLQLPQQNYKQKQRVSHHRSFEGQSSALPELLVKSKNIPITNKVSKEDIQRCIQEAHKRSRSALVSNKRQGKNSAKLSRSYEIDSYLMAVDGKAMQSYDRGEEYGLNETNFIADSEKELLNNSKHIMIDDKKADDSKGVRQSPSHNSSRSSSKNSSKEHKLEKDPYEDIKLENLNDSIEDSLPVKGSPRYRVNFEEKSVPIQPAQKYFMNPRVNLVNKNVRSLIRERRDSQEYAKMIELEKKKKKLYKMLLNSHSDEISDLLRMHKLQKLQDRNNSSSLVKHPKSSKEAIPSKYSKLPALLLNDRSNIRHKAMPKAALRNYHDQSKQIKLQLGLPKPYLPKGRSPNPDWWG